MMFANARALKLNTPKTIGQNVVGHIKQTPLLFVRILSANREFPRFTKQLLTVPIYINKSSKIQNFLLRFGLNAEPV